MNRFASCCFLLAACFSCGLSFGDTFGSGANSFDIDFVTIGNPGNAGDTDFLANPVGAGSVPYSYRIGKYEISEQMIDKANALGGLGISKSSRGSDKPVTNITWFDAARFVNWLNASSDSIPAYRFDGSGNFQLWTPSDPGYNPNNLYRNSLAKYFLPDVDEWYKAAYYNSASGTYFDYPTGSNLPPTPVVSGVAPGTAVYLQSLSSAPADIVSAGGLSPYGTMAQGGNVDEWEETPFIPGSDGINYYRSRRGGAWDSSAFGLSVTSSAGGFPSIPLNGVGFRVGSSVPEPTTVASILTGCFAFLGFRRRPLSQRRSGDAEPFDGLE